MKQKAIGKKRAAALMAAAMLTACCVPAAAQELVGVGEGVKTAPAAQGSAFEDPAAEGSGAGDPAADPTTEASAAEGSAPQDQASESDAADNAQQPDPLPQSEPEQAGPDMEQETQTETGTAAETECLVLADANEDTEIFIYAPQGSSFPEGTVFRVLTVEDVVKERENGAKLEEQCRQMEDMLKRGWTETLKKYIPWTDTADAGGESAPELERIRAFLPYYVFMADPEGNEIPLPAESELHIILRSETFFEELKSRQDRYLAAWQGKGSEFEEMPEKEMLINEEERLVQIRFRAKALGWFSVLQLDMDQPDPFQTEPPMTEALTEEAQTEGPAEEIQTEGMQTGGSTENVQTEGMQTGGSAENVQTEEAQTGETSEEMFTEEMLTEAESAKDLTQTEELAETDTEEDSEGETDLMIMPLALAPTGVNVTDPSSGFVKMSPDQLDGSFRSAKWYSGITTCTKFNSAGSAVTEFSYGERYFFYPKDDSAKGKFGVIWHKILYADGQWYDMKMTVVNYTDHTYAGASGKQVPSYPLIGFCYTGCHWDFKETLGEYVMKIEFVKNGDSSQTPVKLDTRFQWWDIDNNQRFGIRVGDGSISRKYYQVDQSNVHCRMEAPEVDPGNTYLFLAADGETGMDKAGNVGFALSDCSTYYVAIGYRDHIRESSEYRYSEENIQKWNQSLAGGSIPDVSGSAPGDLGQTDLDILIPPDDAYPVKYVSNDGSSWNSYNYLPTPTSEYYYRIRQYIPWQTSSNYYTVCMIRDKLPVGVEYVGEAKVVRVEDNADVTSYFAVRNNQGTVAAAPSVSLIRNALFYGQTYDLIFKVRMDPTKLEADYSGDTASYEVENISTIQFTYQGGDVYTNSSNTVNTKAFSGKTEQDAPTKRLDGNESLTAKELSSMEDTITFSIYQTVPDNDDAWKIAKVTMTDTLEGCLEYLSAQVYEKGSGGYQASDGWTAGASGQTVTVEREYDPGATTLRFDIRCRLRAGYDMSSYSRVEDNRQSYVIPNTAEVELTWSRGSGSPQTVKKKTNEAYVRYNAGPVSARLLLTKEIDAADIVWAHGNPVFLFCVTGEDVDGGRHTYYEAVEFTPEDAGGGTKLSKTVEISLPAGWYTATEEKTMRYALRSIHSVKGGSVTGKTAVFDLSTASEASATFYNKKTTDEGLTASALTENSFGE